MLTQDSKRVVARVVMKSTAGIGTVRVAPEGTEPYTLKFYEPGFKAGDWVMGWEVGPTLKYARLLGDPCPVLPFKRRAK